MTLTTNIQSLRALIGMPDGDDFYSDENIVHRKRLQAVSGRIYYEVVLSMKDEEPVDKDLISRRYRERLCTLPTKDLEYILWGHEEGLVVRREDTLDAIRSELTERGVLNDD